MVYIENFILNDTCASSHPNYSCSSLLQSICFSLWNLSSSLLQSIFTSLWNLHLIQTVHLFFRSQFNTVFTICVLSIVPNYFVVESTFASGCRDRLRCRIHLYSGSRRPPSIPALFPSHQIFLFSSTTFFCGYCQFLLICVKELKL